MRKLKTNYGSVLVFSLIILFISTVIALGIASTTVISMKMSSTTAKSVGSFQVADSGSEIILQKISKGGYEKINELGTCQNGIVSGNIGDSNKEYEVSFFDNQEPANKLNCGSDISEIAKIKAIGTYAGTTRAVEVAVAAGGNTITISACPSSSGCAGGRAAQVCPTLCGLYNFSDYTSRDANNASSQSCMTWNGNNFLVLSSSGNNCLCECK